MPRLRTPPRRIKYDTDIDKFLNKNSKNIVFSLINDKSQAIASKYTDYEMLKKDLDLRSMHSIKNFIYIECESSSTDANGPYSQLNFHHHAVLVPHFYLRTCAILHAKSGIQHFYVYPMDNYQVKRIVPLYQYIKDPHVHGPRHPQTVYYVSERPYETLLLDSQKLKDVLIDYLQNLVELAFHEQDAFFFENQDLNL